MMKFSKGQKGFTVIELMISMVIFSLVLLMATAAILYITKLHTKGNTAVKVQEAARTIADDITSSLQFTGSDIRYGSTNHAGYTVLSICNGIEKYSYALKYRLEPDTPNQGNGEIKHVLWKSYDADPYSCVPANITNEPPTSNPKDNERMNDGMRLTKLELTGLSGDSWKVVIVVASGENDLFTDGTFTECKNGVGSEYCATATLTKYVQRRL